MIFPFILLTVDLDHKPTPFHIGINPDFYPPNPLDRRNGEVWDVIAARTSGGGGRSGSGNCSKPPDTQRPIDGAELSRRDGENFAGST
jgi:hypothetical protein